MQITSKGQVTIPQQIRNRLGLLPHTKVEFELAWDHARIRKAGCPPDESVRGRLALAHLRDVVSKMSLEVFHGMSTDDIVTLIRGEPPATTEPK